MCYLFILLCLIGAEMKLKLWSEHHLSPKSNRLIFGNHIRLRLYHNSGACLNLMAQKKKLLLLFSYCLTVLIGCFFFLTLCTRGNHLLKFSLTLLLGGAFSNTYDRLKRKYVVDYFSFVTPFPFFNQIVFNLSDFAILIGAFLLVAKS